MSGISGYVRKSGDADIRRIITAMNRQVVHRGPDDEGLFVAGQVGLGHRRLSTVDLSSDAHQPMTRNDGDLAIVFDGAIFNYIELREELIALGQDFRSASDAEVILSAYSAWGDACVDMFNGMWAFAIFDRTRNRIFCSRDRFGIKPFYYAATPDAWMFGSEIRQILPFFSHRRANIRVVQEFLTAANTEPLEETFFEGIYKLRGGHNLIFNLTSNSYSIERYYELKANPESNLTSMNDAIRLYGDQLSTAISLSLRADVTVGSCLSGGLDSSSIATLAAANYKESRGEPFQAITAISELKANDESGFAEQVAKNTGIHWLTVKPSYEDFSKTIDEVVRAQEEPFGSPSVCMQYFVMKTARKNGIPVLLDGQGGDETLLGYDRYYAAYLLSLLKKGRLSYAMKSVLDCRKNNYKMSPLRLMLYLLYFSSARLRYWNYCYRNRYLRETPSLPKNMTLEAKAVRNIKRQQKMELEGHVPSLMGFEDKNSMWHSIQTRLPFLDYKAVETALSLPDGIKINQGWTKYLLRRIMAGKMPDAIVWRKDKIGFEAPDRLWLTQHAAIMKSAVVSSTLLKRLSKPGFFERSYQDLDINTQWRLYSVALWEKAFAVEG